MNTAEKNQLSQEAGFQIRALQKITRWKNMAAAMAAIGVALLYAGFAGADRNLFLGIPGIIMLLAGASGAVILNLGIRNGKRNVEKILFALETER